MCYLMENIVALPLCIYHSSNVSIFKKKKLRKSGRSLEWEKNPALKVLMKYKIAFIQQVFYRILRHFYIICK